MTQDTIDAIKADILAVVNTGGTIAETIAPQYTPLIILGQAVARQVPGLFEDVVKLVQSQQPTDADAQGLAERIAQLSHPEAL